MTAGTRGLLPASSPRERPGPILPSVEHEIAIIFATWHGQAEKIARRIADVAAMHRVGSTVLNVTEERSRHVSLHEYGAAIIVGSVHFGRHPKALTRFVVGHLAALSAMPSAFVSVCGAAAGLDGAAEARSYVHKFCVETGWQPRRILSAAGAVPYSRYGFFTRTFMKYAAKIAGRDSDTSSDHEYTDWIAVENFVREFMNDIDFHSEFQAATAARSTG